MSAAAPLNLITDVAGIRVGNADDAAVMSGVTALIVDGPNVASGIVTGGAPGTRDTDLLDPEMTVAGVNAIVLSGGSAFGLDAAGGVMGWLRSQGLGFKIGSTIVPIVTQAITFDLLNGGDKDWDRQPPYWDLGWQAAKAAATGAFDLGTVGGGYGATTANLKGGLGSASATTLTGFTVGALVVVNAIGSVTAGSGPHFWAAPYELRDEFGGYGLPSPTPADALRLMLKGGAPPSTTIAVVATNATLTKAEAKRLAIMANDGLARAVRPAHAPMDGDAVFVVATGRDARPVSSLTLTELGHAAADCLARAIARGVYEASVPPGPYAGPPAHRDRFAR